MQRLQNRGNPELVPFCWSHCNNEANMLILLFAILILHTHMLELTAKRTRWCPLHFTLSWSLLTKRNAVCISLHMVLSISHIHAFVCSTLMPSWYAPSWHINHPPTLNKVRIHIPPGYPHQVILTFIPLHDSLHTHQRHPATLHLADTTPLLCTCMTNSTHYTAFISVQLWGLKSCGDSL